MKTVQKAADLAVQAGSRLYTDSASSYRALQGYVHEFVNHTKKEYARGDVHENRAECLFSLLKPYLRVFRGISKTNLPGLSLSRLNHGQPGVQAHPEIMQGTAELYHEIADALLPQPDPVFDDATAFDTAVDMLNAQSAIVQGLVGQLLFQGEFLATRFLGGHEDRDLGQRKRQKAQVLHQPTPGGQGIRRGVGNRLIMDTAAVGVTEKEDDEQGIHE